MDTIFIIIGLLLLGGGVAIYKFKLSAKKPAAKKPAKKAKGNIVKKDDPFYEKNPDRDPLVKLAKDAEKKSAKKPRRKSKAKAKK
jgi:hypothetical protein